MPGGARVCARALHDPAVEDLLVLEIADREGTNQHATVQPESNLAGGRGPGGVNAGTQVVADLLRLSQIL